MQVKDAYKRLAADVGQKLAAAGFERRGSSFYSRRANNWGLIQFQKSKKSTPDQIFLAVNLGVASARLRRFFSGEQPNPPGFSECHWAMRLGSLLEGRDKWWEISATTRLEALTKEVEAAVMQHGVPEVERYIDDASLRDLWSAGPSPGLTDVQRLMNLVVLVKALGPSEKLPDVKDELRRRAEGSAASGKVSWLLGRLQEVSPEAAGEA